MTFRDLLVSAVAGLWQQKLRTLLTLCGVTLGAMLLFCSISGGLGVLNALQQRLAIGNRLLTIRVSSGWKPADEDQKQKVKDTLPDTLDEDRRDRLAGLLAQNARSNVRQVLSLDRIEEISKWPGVDKITPSLSFSQIRFDGIEFEGEGFRSRVEALRMPGHAVESLIVAGRMPTDNSAKEIVLNETMLFRQGYRTQEDFESLIGKEVRLVQTFGRSPSEENLKRIRVRISAWERLLNDKTLPQEQRDTIQLELEQLRSQRDQQEQATVREVQSDALTVVGIFHTPVNEALRRNPSQTRTLYNFAFIPLDTGRQFWLNVNSSESTVSANVLAKDAVALRALLKRLEDENYRCNSLAEIAQRIRSAVLMVAAVITLIAGGAFFIAAIGMTNTMIMNVLERRREIGILKSIGARDRDVLWMFLLEGGLVGALGGLIGLGLALTLTHVAGDYIRVFLEKRLDEPVGESLFSYPWWLLVGTPILAGVVTTLASMLPARRASRLDPVTTLRTL